VNETSALDTEKCSVKKSFGNSIKFQTKEYFQDVSSLNDLISPSSILSSAAIDTFSMTYTKKKEPKVKAGPVYDKFWLSRKVNNEHLVDPLVTIVKSNRSNDEIQNELCELLGFDNLDVIQELLEVRAKLVKNLNLVDKKEEVVLYQNNQKKQAINQPAPDFLMPVLVQSEKEKELAKMARKDEKKLKSVKFTEVEEDDLLVALRLSETEAQLQRAHDAPIISLSGSTRPALRPQLRYPNVYDETKEAKAHIGFLANTKIMLPADTERKNNQMYEEVTIPARNLQQDLKVGDIRIKVESLDEIGQAAFKGIKELNRIQSVVFDTAYTTNHNLLICAPTGAGKTNIAMLTIVNTIRAFTDQGMIHRDQFKIVYVAPMKALAAEMTENFSKRLKPLGILVRELTGDMQLTKAEMQATQILVTTPEKWDVVTRKGTGDVSLISLVKLLIIDEVHILHGDRGPVIEALVARTKRLVESSQSMIRIVGLSATLPNYLDVALFLNVNPYMGLFFFDSRFRPIPLKTQFIGVKALKSMQAVADMNTICYEKCIEQIRNGKQVMVFVHARNATTRTAMVLREMAEQKGHTQLFAPEKSLELQNAIKAFGKSRNKQLNELFQFGFSTHHAGMMREDRTLVERFFGEGLIKVLVCTATLAWGVNL
jgi:activating signal cointegrator complex subunit 3